tara:strand:- start:526 stop:1350 length:825 start_codon:yes stop_codon:yes gene_type:complete
MSKIKLNVWSGLCNQLLPLVSCIYLAEKFNKNIIYNAEPLWVCDYKTNYYIYEFFIFPNICKKNDILLTNNYNDYIITNDNCINTINLNNNLFIEKCYWLFCLDNEINKFKPQPFTNIIKNNYLLDIQKILHNIKLIDILNQKIKETTRIFDNNTVGIHFRGADGGFTSNKNNIEKLDNLILSLDQNQMIYLSCDCYNIEIYIKKKFKDKIITMINPFGNDDSQKVCNNKNSVMNSICEMYILSKCNELYGTRTSSFTFTAWLLSKINELKFWN